MPLITQVQVKQKDFPCWEVFLWEWPKPEIYSRKFLVRTHNIHPSFHVKIEICCGLPIPCSQDGFRKCMRMWALAKVYELTPDNWPFELCCNHRDIFTYVVARIINFLPAGWLQVDKGAKHRVFLALNEIWKLWLLDYRRMPVASSLEESLPPGRWNGYPFTLSL